MVGTNLFEWLVNYHIESNLKEGLENEIVRDGLMFFHGKNGKEISAIVGTENGQSWYKGLLLLTNGSDITDILRGAEIINSKIQLSFKYIKDEKDFFEFLKTLTGKDNAVIHDRAKGRITKARINNTSPSLRDIVSEDILPLDYLSEDKSVGLYDEHGWTNVGNRSDVAVKASREVLDAEKKYRPVDTYLIKHTIYNRLGFGPVMHFSKDNMDMFFFRYAPNSKGSFIDKEHKIVGVYRTYGLTNGRYTQSSENIVDIRGGKLAYSDGKLVFFSGINLKKK